MSNAYGNLCSRETSRIQGFLLIRDAFSENGIESILQNLVPGPLNSVGTRCLLSESWCSALAKIIIGHPLLNDLIPVDHVAVQCTYFEKSAERNWLVPIHQDLSIPVAERVDDPRLQGWSEKEGSRFVQAPTEVLEQLIAVRLHPDDCGAADGPLRVVPGSHRRGKIAPDEARKARAREGEIACEGARGSILMMRPLLLHSSSKAAGVSRRRVLHYVFGPRSLPLGLTWPLRGEPFSSRGD